MLRQAVNPSIHPSKPKILIVDADALGAPALTLQLASMGYEPVGIVSHGEQVIVRIGELRPDLVLMDVQLAGAMDGISAAQVVRAQFALPVVFLMAVADDETLARARRAEPYGYIRKPSSSDVMGSVIELALNRHKTEQKLLRSEERLRLVLLGSRDGIWDRDLITNEVYYSSWWFEMLGYADNELPSGSAWQNLLHPDDQAHAMQFAAEIEASDARHFDLEVRLRHKAGHYVPVHSRGLVVRDASGKAVRVAGTDTDLTARKQAEEKLRRSEQNLAITLQSIGDAVIATDAAGLITRMNVTAERLTGWAVADAAGQPLSVVFCTDESQKRASAINPVQLLMQGEAAAAGLTLRTALRSRDGREYQISARTAPIRDAPGQVVGIVLVFSDVTGEVRAQQAHTRTSALLERTSELANVGGWELDLATMTMFWSRETFRIHEVDPPVVPSLEEGIKLFVPGAQPILRAAMRAAIDNGVPYDLELQKMTAKGRLIWVRTQGTAVLENGKVTKLLGAFHDCTQRKLAETALQESEGRYRAIVELSPEPVVISRDGIALYVNPAAVRMFAAGSAEDLTGKPILDRIHPDFQRAVLVWLKRVAEGTTLVPLIEMKFLRLDGTVIDVELQSVLIAYDGASAMHTSLRDVTERKQAERALELAQRRTAVLAQLGRELAEATTPKTAAIQILQAAQQLLRWDAGWLQLWDERHQIREALVSFDRVDGEIREVPIDIPTGQAPSQMARTVREEGPQLLLRDSESDGNANADLKAYGSGRRSLSLMLVPIRLGGRFTGIVSIQSYQRQAYNRSDLALLESLATHCAGALARLKSADDLRASEERYRSLVEWSPEAIAVHRDGIVIYVNPVAVRMFGAKSADDLLGKPMLDRVHPDFRPLVLTRLKHITAGSDTPMALLKYLKVDGTAIDVEVQSTSIVYGGALAVHVAIRDITERTRAEETQASLEAQLRESQKMEAIGTLAGGVAHDFNNILATIMGNLELAREDLTSNPRALESLAEIHKAGSRARDLVQQILSFSRRQPTERKVMSLAPVIAESARLLRTAIPMRVTLDVQCEADAPAVLANANQMEQLLINLVNNAVFAIRDGQGRVRIRLDSVTLDAELIEAHPALRSIYGRHPGCTARLAVSDNGLGMNAATLGRIFEPFFTTKPVDEGTGLGLSVVHGIVKAHDGAIEVKSQPDKGTTFTIYLPASTETPANLRESEESSMPPPPVHAASSSQHILYIDDDASLIFLVQRRLERRGYRISGYSNQSEALAALSGDPAAFDLVVTDYNMPGMSGLDVARKVRLIRDDLPVVIASGFIDETLRAQARGAGVRELVFKANAIEDLCNAFARLAQTLVTGAKLP